MLDPTCAIFRSSDHIIYKQIFSHLEADELNNSFKNITSKSFSNLATGLREHLDINLEEYFDISNRILIVLQDYFLDLRMDKYCRFYSHKYGEVKPHTDGSHDNQSNYTLLIYLTDDFENGQLSIKTKRTVDDRKVEPDKLHHVFTFKPMKGYGVIFHKNLLHWTDMVIGDKNFLLIHLNGSAC
jgi:hypothetical protein